MIKAEKVYHSYGNHNVLNGINLKVKEKNFVGIVGPNGSGKSTFLKCVYRVLEPTMGVIKLEDIDIQSMKTSDSAKKMSVVAQHNYHNFDFIVEDMVLMGRSPYKKTLERNNKEDYEIVKESLKTVDMTKYSKREFASLSGGEQQRVILARALAQKPKCLILDEPTNHLDIKHQLNLLNIIKRLDISVVAAIHDLNIAMTYCDEVYVLKEGKVMACGKTDEVLTEEIIRQAFEVEGKVYELDDRKHIVFDV